MLDDGLHEIQETASPPLAVSQVTQLFQHSAVQPFALSTITYYHKPLHSVNLSL